MIDRICLRLSLAVVCAMTLGALRAGDPLGMEFVRVPAPGGAANPGDPSEALSNPYPRYPGSVGYEYRIGMYEVTRGQYCDFLNCAARSDPYGLYNGGMGIGRSGTEGAYEYVVVGGLTDRPVSHVSWFDAARFTNWLTTADTENGVYDTTTWEMDCTRVNAEGVAYSLPTEDEWYKGAYYDPTSCQYFSYATGSNTLPTAGLPTSAPNHANYGSILNRTTDVGSYPGSSSPYGTFDQAGNLWEWNDRLIPYGSTYYRGLRGGAFYNLEYYVWKGGRYVWGYYGYRPETETEGIGFRVASVSVLPEPACGEDQVIAAVLPDGTAIGRASRPTYGFAFSPSTDIAVTHIGVWEALEPLGSVQTVLQSRSRGVLFSARLTPDNTIPDGPVNTAEGGYTGRFRYMALPDCIDLAIGEECLLYAYVGGTVVCHTGGGEAEPCAAPEITYLGSAFPDRDVWWGPNFQFVAVDTTPPSIEVLGLPDQLWPPNHSLVRLTPLVEVHDDQDLAPAVSLSVVSNEPDNGMGDGDTAGDAIVYSPSDFELRAERSGRGSGRSYTLTWTATDAAGNSSTYSVVIAVPRSR